MQTLVTWTTHSSAVAVLLHAGSHDVELKTDFAAGAHACDLATVVLRDELGVKVLESDHIVRQMRQR